jgi:hypothetical protein
MLQFTVENSQSKIKRKVKDRAEAQVYNSFTSLIDDDHQIDYPNIHPGNELQINEPKIMQPQINEPQVNESQVNEPQINESQVNEPQINVLPNNEQLFDIETAMEIGDSNIEDEEISNEDDASSNENDIDYLDDLDDEMSDNIDEFMETVDEYEKEIYKNSEIKLKHFIIVFIESFHGIKIPHATLSKFLNFIRMIVPNENLNIPKNFKSLLKFYGLSKVQNKKICAKCSDELGDDAVCLKQECVLFKGIAKNSNKNDPILTEFEIASDLKELLEKKWHAILEYREILRCNLVSDFCNSEYYKSKNLALNSISFILFIDGAQFNKGSNGSIWAILGIVANLPPLIRSTFNNIMKILLIHGTLFDFNGIFSKHLSKLKNLLENGIEITLSNGITKITVNIHALLADNPGRSKTCYCRQHNGRFGCFHCLNECYTTDGEK